MIRLTDEMRDLINNNLANGTPCVLATASSQGDIGISFRGSMMVWDEESLAYWDRSLGRGLEHIGENPKVAVLFRDPARRVGWKFFGRVQVYRDGPLREQVMARVATQELARDPDRLGCAVIIKLERVESLAGHMLMEREQQNVER